MASNTERKGRDGEDLLFGGQVTSYGDQRQKLGCCEFTRKHLFILLIIILLVIAVGLIVLGIYLKGLGDTNKGPDSSTATGPVKGAVIGAVVSDHEDCSDVGRDILNRHGTAVDAAIATLLCNGARTPHSMGIGGGCFMVVYPGQSKQPVFIDGREAAPGKVMTSNDLRNDRARSIGVPGELKAYKAAHDMYGRLPWKDLFQPTIKMLKKGFPISKATASAMEFLDKRANFTDYPELCNLVCKNTTTGILKKEGDMLYWPKLAETYQGIAENGPDYIYNSPHTSTIVREIQDANGVLDEEDLIMKYKVRSGEALGIDLGDYTYYSMGGATGGPVVGLILNILKGFNFSSSDLSTTKKRADTYHKIIEATKLAYADRNNLGDPEFVNVSAILEAMQSSEYADYLRSRIKDESQSKDYYTNATSTYKETVGTSHVSVLSPYGDAVSVTSTINWYFGSMIMSKSTGIIWNNEMEDFDPKGTVNEIEPGKRPLSSMVPVIIVDKSGRVRLVTGAAGGSKIATVVAQTVAKLLFMDQPLEGTTEEKRFHSPVDELVLEKGFPEDLKKELINKSHTFKEDTGQYMAVVQSILADKSGGILGYADSRKPPGAPSYLYDSNWK